MGEVSTVRRMTLCRLGWCQTFRTAENDTHLWGQCERCGKRSGVVSRAEVRRYIEREEALKAESSHGA